MMLLPPSWNAKSLNCALRIGLRVVLRQMVLWRAALRRRIAWRLRRD
jgi:hypothetical protein